MKKMSLVLLALMLSACATNESSTVKHGSAEVKGEDATTTVSVTLEGDQITEITIDQSTEDSTKRTLGADYNMKQASSINKEWDEQMDFLQSYIIDHNTTKIEMNDAGKATDPEVLSGCTVSIKEILNAVDLAVENAK